MRQGKTEKPKEEIDWEGGIDKNTGRCREIFNKGKNHPPSLKKVRLSAKAVIKIKNIKTTEISPIGANERKKKATL